MISWWTARRKLMHRWPQSVSINLSFDPRSLRFIKQQQRGAGPQVSSLKKMKFAFVSEGLPPSWSGQSVVIYRLLKDLDPEEYCLITQDYGQGREHREKKEGRLRAKYYYIPRRYAIPKGWRFSFVRWINIKLRAWQIARI